MRLKSASKRKNEKIRRDSHRAGLAPNNTNMKNFFDANIRKTGQSVAPGPAHVQTIDITMKDSSLQRYKKSGEPSRPAGMTKVKNVFNMLVQIYKKIGRTLAAIPT